MNMKFALAVIAAVALVTPAAQADPYHTGLKELTVLDDDGARHLRGFLWYPTDQVEGAVQAHGNAVWESIAVVPDAVPVAGAHPLVVLSHGMYGNARNQAWLAERLVSNGYVVAAIDHPGTSTFQRDPDDSRALWERPRDISRTIDYLIDGSAMGGSIDPDRIFVAGHSLGGFTAVALAGGRYDPDGFATFCADHPGELVCGIFDRWGVAKTPEDRAAMSDDLSDPRIAGFAIFDLGGTQAFSSESLAAVTRPMLVYGAPVDISGLDLDIESRALVAALPTDRTRYLEPKSLAHFDFLGVCTEDALAVLKKEEPDDIFVCEQGRDERRAEHDAIASEVMRFFDDI